jgi:hypothetical protein
MRLAGAGSDFLCVAKENRRKERRPRYAVFATQKFLVRFTQAKTRRVGILASAALKLASNQFALSFAPVLSDYAWGYW